MSVTENQQLANDGRTGVRVSPRQFAATTQGWRAAGLALISGYVDSYTLLNFGVYASFMSGNTTSAGLSAGHANLAAAGHSLLPIPFFVLGIFAGTLLELANGNHDLTRDSLLLAALLTFAIAAAHFAWPGWLNIVILSIVMGIMNTSITHVGGQAVNLEQFCSAPGDGNPARSGATEAGLLGQPLVARSSAGRDMDSLPQWRRAWRCNRVSLHGLGFVAASACVVSFQPA